MRARMFKIYACGNVDALTGAFKAIAVIVGGADHFGLFVHRHSQVAACSATNC